MGRDERRAPLKTPAWEVSAFPCRACLTPSLPSRLLLLPEKDGKREKITPVSRLSSSDSDAHWHEYSELKQKRRRRLRKRHLKSEFALLQTSSRLFQTRSIRQINVGKFFWSWILKDCIKVQEKKKKVVVSCSCPREKVNLGVLSL